MVFKSSSSKETKQFAAALARKFARSVSPRTHALVLALSGELGSGKTTFVQGFFRGLGVRRRIVSPTFILIRRLAIRHKLFAYVYHVDAYRIRTPRELLTLGIEEIFSHPENIALIEWADRVRKILPKYVRWIRFSHGTRENERKIIVHAYSSAMIER